MLYQKIVEYCKKNNMPLSTFEKKCNLGNGTIKGWKKSNPRIDSLQKAANEMGISVAELLDNSGIEKGA